MLNSLHARLLAWLVVPLLFMSGAHLYNTFENTQKTAETIFDKLMVTMALTISEHALASGGDVLTEDLLELIHSTTNDNLYYKVIGPGGAFIMGYDSIPEPPGGIQVLNKHLYFYDAIFLTKEVRVIAVSSLIEGRDLDGWMTTFVAQTRHERDEYVYSALIEAATNVVLLIFVTSVMLYIGVSFGLRPLHKIELTLQSRHPKDMSPIQQDDIPQEIKGLISALNDLLQRLEANIKLTRRFVDNAAHELRTPVSALLPQTDLALRRAESEREKLAVGKIRTSADKIARLTDQLLNLATAEASNMSRQSLKPVDLATLVAQHIASRKDIYPEENIAVELGTAPINGIALAIDEVLSNLIDNAKKYGGNSAIMVRTFQQRSQSSARSVLEVIDQGPGIPAADRVKVTERFFRLAKDTYGSGLGLAIVKEIVEAHRGSLKITQGADNAGTCVRCSFPAQAQVSAQIKVQAQQ